MKGSIGELVVKLGFLPSTQLSSIGFGSLPV